MISGGIRLPLLPSYPCTSLPQIPQALTRIRTSSAVKSGLGLSWIWRTFGSVLPTVKVYNKRDVDELIILDTLGYQKKGFLDYEFLNDITEECFVPLTIGGGINNHDQVQKILESGADKISLNSALFSNVSLVGKIANKFGNQCIVGSVDVKKIDKKWICFKNCATEKTEFEVTEWVKILEDNGIGEILITSIDKDGLMQGYDLPLIETVVNKAKVPIIASGGAGKYSDFVDAIIKSGASAVAASSMFIFTERTPAEAKKIMKKNNIHVRMSIDKIDQKK